MTRDERITQAVQDMLIELMRAEHIHPIWPGVGHTGDHVWAAAVTNEENGELTQAALDYQAHGKGSVAHMKREAIHLGAMAIRFLVNLDAVETQRINESARQELSDEHNVYVYPQASEGLSLNESEWRDEQPSYRLHNYTEGMDANA